MSGMLNKYLEKGKAKLKEIQQSQASSGQGHSSQGYPGQGYTGQQQQHHQPYPQQPYQQQSYNAPPPNQYQQYPPPPQNQQWGPPPGPPPNQWGPPPNQWGSQPPPQQQAFSPPPQQAFSPPPNQPFSPPVPQNSKPQSQPPPVPGNRPGAPPIPNNRPSSQAPPPQTQLQPYWQPSFDASTPVSHHFRHELGDHGWGNNEKQNYVDSPANSFHHDNRLIVRALVQNGSYTSARLTSHQTLSRSKGYLTVTVVSPVAEGIWPAFWMLPKDPFQWPNDGEVDIFESWNGDSVNHSCLHWGHFNGEDWNKHRVLETKLPEMGRQPHTMGFAWIEEEGIPDWRGRMIWYIDGRPVMKGNIPPGTRRMEEFRILINIAMGGNVCQGKLPADGYYDFVISDLKMCEEPVGGWGEFERVWIHTPEGKTM
ncbi:glycoside hydrolase family 16 protein [Aaosphaeria arxii CBS 175.79]|uniref:Glycoside hydrolase family 16 protein n=1 Tax=Aaosphaeria arxii CBS 175.79 TaxID=1450172 RepID=A0A6A5Y3R7_9PLEO|nr:glycoside hydrolase family 16 protein [Aaosphaeria arxii CBS 175.79]KAF2020205.1 glycoside hydrolase family 16 protein [Aaosphaeria arxii CBS 175.79]